jgi:hypothetical protein
MAPIRRPSDISRHAPLETDISDAEISSLAISQNEGDLAFLQHMFDGLWARIRRMGHFRLLS